MPALARPLHPDPAWRGRVTATVVCLLLLWPMLAASEFKPWILFDPQSLAAAGMFHATQCTSGFAGPSGSSTMTAYDRAPGTASHASGRDAPSPYSVWAAGMGAPGSNAGEDTCIAAASGAACVTGCVSGRASANATPDPAAT